MLNRLKRSNSKGFTIIEVMIVLAIAGLILLIVFLAVPALQRNTRNTQRKNDAAQIAAAIANYINNNGGQLPSTATTGSTSNELKILAFGGGGGGCPVATSGPNAESAKLGYYIADSTHVKFDYCTSAATVPDTEHVVVDDGYNCNSTNTGVGTAASRTAAILYQIEGGSGSSVTQCVEQ